MSLNPHLKYDMQRTTCADVMQDLMHGGTRQVTVEWQWCAARVVLVVASEWATGAPMKDGAGGGGGHRPVWEGRWTNGLQVMERTLAPGEQHIIGHKGFVSVLLT